MQLTTSCQPPNKTIPSCWGLAGPGMPFVARGKDGVWESLSGEAGGKLGWKRRRTLGFFGWILFVPTENDLKIGVFVFFWKCTHPQN